MGVIKKILVFVIISFFIGCANNNKGIQKVYEEDYPENISVIFHNGDLRDDLKIISSRLVNGKYKKQVQLVVDNDSSNVYNIIIAHEWTDSRGTIINNHEYKTKVKLGSNSSKRVVLNAPSFKGKDVLINISCDTTCIE